MCGGFVGNLFSSVLGLITGGGQSSQSVEQPKVTTKPAEIDDGTASLKAKQDEKKRAARYNGMNSNILGASSTTSAVTGQKTLLGE